MKNPGPEKAKTVTIKNIKIRKSLFISNYLP